MGTCRAKPQMVTQPDELIRGIVSRRGVGGHRLVEDVVATEAAHSALKGCWAKYGDLMASAQELLDNPRLDDCTASAVPHHEEEVTIPDLSLCHLALILSIVVAIISGGHGFITTG